MIPEREPERRLPHPRKAAGKIPEGSGDSGSGRPDRVVEVQRAPGKETAANRRNRVGGGGADGRTGHGNYLAESEVAGWELWPWNGGSREAAFVAGEQKAVTSDRSRAKGGKRRARKH